MLTGALNSTVVAAVGPTCAKTLRAYGVTPDVVPDPPKMGHMVAELAEYFSEGRTPRR